MKPETILFLDKAQSFLNKAASFLAIDHPDEAGRAAYLAGFHSAQAFLFESRGETPKTHGGVQGEFSKLIKDDDRFDLEMRRFLGRAYSLKGSADYETGPGAIVSVQQATDAIAMAKRLVAMVTAALAA